MDENLAIDFIKRHGDPVEQARLRYLRSGERPSEGIRAGLLNGQKPDGGFAAFWAPGARSLDATCYRMAQADQLGLDASEPGIERASAFLQARKRADGCCEEEESLKTVAPPWAAPGDPAARFYLTANCGFWMGVLGASNDRAEWIGAARKAASYLDTQIDDRGKLPSFLHAHWLAAGLWACLEDMEVASRVCGYLQERRADLSPSNLAWMLVTLGIAGKPSPD